jgi:hypothetical protein
MKAIVRWLHPSSWHGLVIFLMLGVFGALFAWFTFNLVEHLMANFRFIAAHGLVALRAGGLRQAAELLAAGYLAIAFYIAFKACEVELLARFRGDAGAPRPVPALD